MTIKQIIRRNKPKCDQSDVVQAIREKVKTGLKPIEHRINPRWEHARYEIRLMVDLLLIEDYYPYRYDDKKACLKHLETGLHQPGCIPQFITVWSDGSTTETLWDENAPHLNNS